MNRKSEGASEIDSAGVRETGIGEEDLRKRTVLSVNMNQEKQYGPLRGTQTQSDQAKIGDNVSDRTKIERDKTTEQAKLVPSNATQ